MSLKISLLECRTEAPDEFSVSVGGLLFVGFTENMSCMIAGDEEPRADQSSTYGPRCSLLH